MELARPLVFVLTDGSGHTGQSRLVSTMRVLDGTGARKSEVFGRFTDPGIYAAMLDDRGEMLVNLMCELSRILVTEGIDYIAHDAVEGYNPSHDLCWHLACTAARLARKSGREISNFDFLLTGRPDECPAEARNGAVQVALDDAALARKLAAAEAYPELKAEVDGARRSYGNAPFAVEWLRPVTGAPDLSDSDEAPFYERYGESRRAQGRFANVIRKNAHVLPIARMLWKTAAEA